jgi:putative two-component system response regulator
MKAKTQEKPLVLIVDDQPDNLYMYSRFIDGDGHFRVITAMNGNEALQKARRFAPAVVLLDLAMPEMSGYDVVRALAANVATRDIPVVLLSAYASQAEAAAALGGDGFASFVGDRAEGYVSKPCLPATLLAHVKKVVGRRAIAPSSIGGSIVALHAGTEANDGTQGRI